MDSMSERLAYALRLAKGETAANTRGVFETAERCRDKWEGPMQRFGTNNIRGVLGALSELHTGRRCFVVDGLRGGVGYVVTGLDRRELIHARTRRVKLELDVYPVREGWGWRELRRHGSQALVEAFSCQEVEVDA